MPCDRLSHVLESVVSGLVLVFGLLWTSTVFWALARGFEAMPWWAEYVVVWPVLIALVLFLSRES